MSRKRRRGLICGVLGIAMLMGAAFFWARKTNKLPQSSKSEASHALRTAAVWVGDLHLTLRVTGVTAAENYATLIGPQLRGSRSRSGRGYSRSSSYAATDSSGDVSAPSKAVSALPSSAAFSKATQRSASGSTSSFSVGASGFSGLGSTASSLPSGSPSSGSSPTDSTGDYMLVLQKLIKPGSHVKKSDIVAEFDRQNMLNRLDDYRMVVVQSQTGHETLHVTIDTNLKAHEQKVRAAKAEADKAQLDLKTTPVRSAIDSEFLKLGAEETQARHKQLLDEVKYVEVSKEAQLRRSELELQQQQIELKRSENNVNKMVVRAPMDGVTVMQTTYRSGEFGQVQQGDLLYPGMNFMQIVDPSSMVINAVLNQADSELLRIGQKAVVRFDAYPDLMLPARVHAIGAMTKTAGFRASFVKEIPIVLKLEKLDPRVIPDLSVGVDIVLATAENATIAPKTSIFGGSGSEKPFVFVREAAGWARREVELGLMSNTAAVVRSGVEKGTVLAAEWPPGGGGGK